MKAIQNNTGLKLLAAVLCCLFLGAAAGTAVGAIWEISQQDEYSFANDPGNVRDFLMDNCPIWNYMDMVMDVYRLEQQNKELSKAERIQYKKSKERLSSENTNFRCRLLQPDGSVLWDNLDEAAFEEAVKSHRYVAVTQNRNDAGNYSYRDYDDGTNLDELMDHYYYDEEEDIWFEEDSYDFWQEAYGRIEAEEYDTTEAAAATESTLSEASEEPEEIVNNLSELVAVIEWGIAEGTPVEDDFAELAQSYRTLKKHMALYTAVELVCGLGWLLSLVALLYGCGHKEGVEGIYLATGHRCPADLLLGLEAGLIVVGAWVGIDLTRMFDGILLNGKTMRLQWWIGICSGLLMLVLLPLFTTVTAQLKAKEFLKRTLCCRILRWGWRGVCWVCRFLLWLVRGIGLFWKAVLGYCALEGIIIWSLLAFANWWDYFYQTIAASAAVVGLVLLLWWLTGWRKVRIAAEKLAQGDLRYQMKPGIVPWDIKKHINNLNEISGGMQKAVQKQMKSDRFRTELITNVSHDLKTPLTSIINYVDLLKKQDIQDATAREYIDVLDRKSQRLKTLTEDLVEASKAATGVLAVNAERLEAGQLVHQALGEYEAKLTLAGLKAVVQIPQEPVYINADGRHLWRILDNLLGNCAKYAMPGTRVYVTVETADGTVSISVKNISAEPLNVPAEELMERFVRGDSSRTNEGSGLGLSIAQSLAVIQGAAFHVSVDGDLFKAEIQFPVVP